MRIRPVPALKSGLAGVVLSLALAAPLMAQEVVENDVAKVFDGKWMQSKEADKNGLLMYLTQERAMTGDYFSIRCDEGGRSVRLGFGTKLPGVEGREGRGKDYQADVTFTIDGAPQVYRAEYTGKKPDPAISGGDIHAYRVLFADDAALDGFLNALRQGSELRIAGQAEPVSLAGSAQAIEEQAGYCK